jgi:hypothetical protein
MNNNNNNNSNQNSNTKDMRRREITVMLITVMLLFIILQTPAVICNSIYGINYSKGSGLGADSLRLNTVCHVGNFSIITCSSINFFTYLIFNKRFRREFYELILCICCCCAKSCIKKRRPHKTMHHLNRFNGSFNTNNSFRTSTIMYQHQCQNKNFISERRIHYSLKNHLIPFDGNKKKRFFMMSKMFKASKDKQVAHVSKTYQDSINLAIEKNSSQNESQNNNTNLRDVIVECNLKNSFRNNINCKDFDCKYV